MVSAFYLDVCMCVYACVCVCVNVQEGSAGREFERDTGVGAASGVCTIL